MITAAMSLLAGLGASFTSAAEPVEVVRSEVAVDELNVDLVFTCPLPGLPTVTLHYVRGDANQRMLRFWQAREPAAEFILQDGVTKITKESGPTETRWQIEASGDAEKTVGAASGGPVSAMLVIRQPTDNSGLKLDFEVRAGDFVRAENGCPRGPAIDRRSKVVS